MITKDNNNKINGHVDENDDVIDLGAWFGVIYDWRNFILKFTVCCLILGIILALNMKPVFRSKGVVLLPTGGSPVGLFGGIVTQLSAATGTGWSPGLDFFKRIITSRMMAAHLDRRFDLKRRYEVNNNDPIAYEEFLDSIPKLFTISPSDGGFFNLEAESPDPRLSQDLAYEVILKTNEIVNELNVMKAREKRIFFERRITDLEREIEGLGRSILEYSTKNGIIEFEPQASGSVSAAAEFTRQLAELKAKMELRGLSDGAEHPEVKLLTREIELLEKRIETLRTGGGSGSSSKEGQFMQDPNNYPFLPLNAIPALGLKYQAMRKELTTRYEVLALIQQQYELARSEEKKEDLYLRFLDSPSYSEQPYGKRRLIVLASLGIGLLGGITIATLGAWIIRLRQG